jgi:two-component system, cell cycle sensor histidine kinase and response regulator CckA
MAGTQLQKNMEERIRRLEKRVKVLEGVRNYYRAFFKHGARWDITEKDLSEKAVRKSEQHYRLLTENVTDTIWMMSLDGTFLYHSPSVEKLRGYTPSEADQITLEQTLTPESMSFVRIIFQEENSKPMEKRWADRTLELEMYRKDGTTVWTEVSVRAVRDENGTVVGLQGSTRDIDERKQSEMSLLQAEQKWRKILVNTPQK